MLRREDTQCLKRICQDVLEPLLWGQPTLMPWECTILCLLNKILSYNWAVTLACLFKSLLWRDRTKEITHSPTWHLWCHDLDVTWLKQPQLGPSDTETKHSRSPTHQKLTMWKLNAKETQHSGCDENPNPSVLETGTAETSLVERSCSSVSDSKNLRLR